MEDCLFCKIAAGEIPSQVVYEDDDFLAFKDIDPKADAHVLLIAKKHHASLLELTEQDASLMGKMMIQVSEIAKQLNLQENGFRVVINTGRDGGQTVAHLHIHILGGRPFAWPPG